MIEIGDEVTRTKDGVTGRVLAIWHEKVWKILVQTTGPDGERDYRCSCLRKLWKVRAKAKDLPELQQWDAIGKKWVAYS